MAVLIYNISIKLYTTFLCYYIIERRWKYEVSKILLLKRKVAFHDNRVEVIFIILWIVIYKIC